MGFSLQCCDLPLKRGILGEMHGALQVLRLQGGALLALLTELDRQGQDYRLNGVWFRFVQYRRVSRRHHIHAQVIPRCYVPGKFSVLSLGLGA